MTPPPAQAAVGCCFPAEVISHAARPHVRFPLSLRTVDDLPAARGISASHGWAAKRVNGRQWAPKVGQGFANQVRRRLPAVGDRWHLDEAVLTVAGARRWLWRAVDQTGTVPDILVQGRRDTRAAKRLMRKLPRRQCRAPRVMVADRLARCGAARREVTPPAGHRRHKGLNRAEALHTSPPGGGSGR